MAYVPIEIYDTKYVDTAGDSMSGLLVLSANPGAALGAATKQYVDSKPSGGIKYVIAISSNTTGEYAVGVDYIYKCGAVLTFTLPTAVGNTSKYTVKNNIAGTITIATTAGQTIDNTVGFSIPTQYMSVDFLSDGVNWMII